MSKRKMKKTLVYSTEHGRICPRCSKPRLQCVCKQNTFISTGDSIVRLMRETKGRKGKGVSLVTGIPLDSGELKALAKQLKQRCGSGGTVKEGVIEIQGDHRDTLMEELVKLGYTVKLVGG